MSLPIGSLNNLNTDETDMAEQEPLVDVFRRHIKLRGMSRTELIKRAGYNNVAKGLRRFDSLMAGDESNDLEFVQKIANALELNADELELALQARVDFQDRRNRESFEPHAIVRTERTMPSQIFVAALMGVHRMMRVEFQDTSLPLSFVDEILDKLPTMVPTFGRVIGFAINFSPDYAVEFDLNGSPIRSIGQATQPGIATLTVNGKPIPDSGRGHFLA